MIRKARLLAAIVALGACTDPAGRIAAPDNAASLDCDPRQHGSGNLAECECRQNGSGQLVCL